MPAQQICGHLIVSHCLGERSPEKESVTINSQANISTTLAEVIVRVNSDTTIYNCMVLFRDAITWMIRVHGHLLLLGSSKPVVVWPLYRKRCTKLKA